MRYFPVVAIIGLSLYSPLNADHTETDFEDIMKSRKDVVIYGQTYSRELLIICDMFDELYARIDAIEQQLGMPPSEKEPQEYQGSNDE